MNSEQARGVFLTTSPETRSINARRISTGEVATRVSSVSKSEGKATPPYLRTSTGSCHDLCKHGKKQSFESKARSPTFPRYSVSGTSSGRAQVQVPSLREKQKRPALKQQVATHPEICLHDGPNVSEKRFFSPMKTVKSIQESETRKHASICNERSVPSESEIKCNLPSTSKKICPLKGFKTIKQGTLQKIGSCDHTEVTAQESPTSLKKTKAPANSDNKMKRAPHEVNLSMENASAEQRNLSAETTFSTKHKVEQKVPSLVKKTVSAVKPKTLPANRFDASAKPALPGRSNVTFVKPGSQQKPTTRITDRKFGTMIVKNINLSEPHGKISLKSPSESMSPQSPPNHVSKSASPLKHAKKFEDTTGHEEEEYPESESVSSGPCDLVSDDGGDNKKIAAQNEDKKSDEKMSIVHSKYEDQIPYQFRSEKILEPSSNDGDTRLLRFRQGIRTTGSQSGEGEFDKMNFKMKELICKETSQPDPEGQAVVLRHQGVQDKKETVSLFNNVIEETASKLVELRKSKVKALVGAFETVISLQERRPTAPV